MCVYVGDGEDKREVFCMEFVGGGMFGLVWFYLFPLIETGI